MSARRIRETLAALEEAGERLRQRPAAEVLEVLAALLEQWRDPETEARLALAKRLPDATGFPEAMVGEGLDLALAGWTGEALRRLVDRELGGVAALEGDPSRPRAATGFDSTSVMLAGSLPTPTLLALLSPLVLRSPLLVKPASRDPVTPHVFADSLASLDPDLAGCVGVISFERGDVESLDAFLEADCVVATGSDETLAQVAARAQQPQRFVAYGHQLSVAVLGPDAVGVNAAMDGLALDVTVWNQLGCLSPIALYVVGRASAERAAEALADRLAGAELRWPRGPVPTEVAALLAHERAEAEMRAASQAGVRLYSGDAGEWTVVCEADASPRPAPLYRFVRIHPVESIAGLQRALRPLAPHLASVGVAGFGAEEPTLLAMLAGLGASRICALGAMQAPPIDWCHDGLGVLTPLARFTDRELS